jgi:hypothetical protein
MPCHGGNAQNREAEACRDFDRQVDVLSTAFDFRHHNERITEGWWFAFNVGGGGACAKGYREARQRHSEGTLFPSLLAIAMPRGID